VIPPILAQMTNVACLRIEEVMVRVDGLIRHFFAQSLTSEQDIEQFKLSHQLIHHGKFGYEFLVQVRHYPQRPNLELTAVGACKEMYNRFWVGADGRSPSKRTCWWGDTTNTIPIGIQQDHVKYHASLD
jgi:hypothetical protein